jgi:hypothetical protein
MRVLMKLSLGAVALIVGVAALLVAAAQPTYNYFVAMQNAETGKPSFDIRGFYLWPTYTEIFLWNNGTATAHNIDLDLAYYNGSEIWQASQSISEISSGRGANFYVPIGTYQLSSMLSPPKTLSDYAASVQITCKELSNLTFFQFTPAINYIPHH